MAVIDTGTDTAGKANVDAAYNLQTNSPGHTSAGVPRGGGPANAGGAVLLAEIDAGVRTGARLVAPPRADRFGRLRQNVEQTLDSETFNYAAQNTGKHFYNTATMTMTWATAGLTTNALGTTVTSLGAGLSTYANFPVGHGSITTYLDVSAAFTNQPTANATIDFGFFLRAITTTMDPSDGVFFSLRAGGMYGVIIVNGGTETTVGPFPSAGGTGTWVYNNNQNYRFSLTVTEDECRFFIDNELYARLPTPAGQGQPFKSASLPLSIRQGNSGTAGADIRALFSDYMITLGGPIFADSLGAAGNRMLGSYQGLSGGTMGSLASFANSTSPAAAAAISNTTAPVQGLGGQAQVIAPVTGATDGILMSYTVPVGTVAVQGRRLRVTGVRVDAANIGATVGTTPTTMVLSLAFGHTADSLATGEGATTKAPRRVPLGIMSWPVGAVVGACPTDGPIILKLDNPIFVNPNERIAIAAKALVGTATASQVLYFTGSFDYGWE